MHHHNALEAIRSSALPLGGGKRDFDRLLELVADRPFVLLGEATHGTIEFYRMRAEISRRLIEECGFDAVIVEADWPDAYRLNRFVHGNGGADRHAIDAFGDFQRFPTWMWRNHEALGFVDWLAEYNTAIGETQSVGFYGMDLYSLYRSASAVTRYLEEVDPEQAKAARRLYASLDEVNDPQGYGYQAAMGLRPACRDAAAELLTQLVRNAPMYLSGDGKKAADAQFYAERNAYVVLNAEQYYRAMFTGRINTWNLRDAHMVNTILSLRRFLQAGGREGKMIVWAHNSHLGDARATDMGERGEWNVGQLLREKSGNEQVFLVGFTTYTGEVTAAREWDGPAERRWIRPARKDSIEHLFYTSKRDRFFLHLDAEVSRHLEEPMLERAIGVLYRPDSEYASHYFHTRLARQFDAVFHIDESNALEPIDSSHLWQQGEVLTGHPV